MADFTGLSIWSALQDESGVRVAELRDVVAFSDHWSIDDGWSCTIEIGAADAQRAFIINGHVIQVESRNEPVKEFRIASHEDGRSGDADTIVIHGQDPVLDLAEKTILTEIGSGGVVSFDQGAVDLTPQEYLDTYAVPAAVVSGIAVDTGTVEPTLPLTLDWNAANSLSLIRQVIAELRDHGFTAELDYRRDPGNGYLIDILDKIGSTALAPELHVGRHIERWGRTLSRADQASVVVPLGGVDGTGAQATIARAAWQVTAIDGGLNILTVVDPLGGPGPVQVAGQANGPAGDWYVQVPSTGAYLVVISATRIDALTTDVELADVSDFSVGDVFEFRSFSSGVLMYVLTDPTAIAALGAKIVPIVQEQGRGERNLIPNPWARTWVGGVPYSNPAGGPPPAGWLMLAGSKVWQDTDPLHTRFGGNAIRVIAGVLYGSRVIAAGLFSPLTQIWPVAGADLFSVTLALEFISLTNDIQITIIDSTNTVIQSYVIPLASLPKVGLQWDVSIAGIDLSAAVGGVRVGVFGQNISQPGIGSGVEFYWDAVQLTQTPSPADAYTEFSRATALWQYGNAYLAQFADPPPDFEVSLVDLARIDPAKWAHVKVERGATSRLVDDARGLDWNVRVIERTRNRFVSGDTTFTFSARSNSLVALSAGIGPGGIPIPPNTPTPPVVTPPPVPIPPPPPGTASPMIYAVYAGGLIADAPLSSFPSALTERKTSVRGYLPLGTQALVRLSARVVTPLAGAKIRAVWSLVSSGNPVTDWAPFGVDVDGNLGPFLPLDAAGDIVGVSVAIDPAARADVFVAFLEEGGDGATTVEVGNFILTTYGGTATSPFPTFINAIADWNPTEQAGQVLADKINLYDLQLGSTSGVDANDPAWDGASPPYVKYGNDDYCQIWDEVDIIFDDSDTLGVFEFPSPLPSGSASRRHLFGIWGLDGATPDWQVVMYCYESDWLVRFRAKLGDASEVEVVSTTAMVAGATHTIGISYDFLAGSILRLFIDGVEEDASAALAAAMKFLTPRYFYLGNGSTSDPGIPNIRIGRTVKFNPTSMDAAKALASHQTLQQTYTSLP